MKTLGIFRKIDNLGRVVIPKNLLNELKTKEFGITIKKGSIVLTPYREKCAICGGTHEITKFKKKNICDYCKKELKELAERF